VNGQVIGANPRLLTVREINGRATVFQVTPSTQISKGQRRARVAQLALRDRVQVTATRTGNTLTATRIVDSIAALQIRSRIAYTGALGDPD
jgi:hypothetical protein